jgi:hypothetical protein
MQRLEVGSERSQFRVSFIVVIWNDGNSVVYLKGVAESGLNNLSRYVVDKQQI